MLSEMKFMDAAKSDSPSLAESPPKSYPKFTIDLDQFPDLEGEMDESVELHLRGRVCGLNHNEYCHTMEIEVQSVAIPFHTHDTIGLPNEADKALAKMRSLPRRY